MKTLGKIIGILLGLVIAFFAAYAIFAAFAPALKVGAPFIEVVKEMGIAIYNGFRFLFGI